MKLLPRDPVKHEVITLFGAIGHEIGIKLGDPASDELFVDTVRKSLKINRTDSKLWYGRRTEAMFGYVAAALGECVLIKQEDSGQCMVSGKDIRVPDYRLVTKSGRHLLVEVKNCHRDKLVLTKKYVDQLAAYAKLVACELKLAVYWSRDNSWSLLSPDAIPLCSGQYTIKRIDALCIDEMYDLGDFAFWTETPLIARMMIDRSKPHRIDQRTSRVHGTLARLDIFCQDKLIESEIEKAIAVFILDNSRLVTRGWGANFDQGELVSIEAQYDVEKMCTDDEVDFELFGTYSSMLSSEYVYSTSSDRGVEAFTPDMELDHFGVRIPADYKGEYLSILRIKVKPNYSLVGPSS
jgi:Holliday junction resolvase